MTSVKARALVYPGKLLAGIEPPVPAPALADGDLPAAGIVPDCVALVAASADWGI